MGDRLAEAGYPGYRRSDAAVLRFLRRGPVSVGELGAALGVTRQAARKVADLLEQRGYAETRRDRADSRRVNVVLTAAGQAYAAKVVEVIHRLNSDLSAQVDREQLAAADTVLRAAIGDEHARQRAARLVRPPG